MRLITRFVIDLVIIGIIMSGCQKAKNTSSSITNTEPILTEATTNQTIKDASLSAQPENKLCDWIDKSDIIIKLTFADGVVKDTSYEAGFYYSKIGSNMRLARGACDYRTGFSFAEMQNKGIVQVGVRGFSDSNRRKLENEPISVIFDEAGKPNVPKVIEVKVLD